MKNIAILGSTGSIGKQALEVIDNHKDKYAVEVLTAFNNYELLIEQAKKFQPNVVVIVNEEKYEFVRSALAQEDIKVYAGEAALNQVVEMESIDLVLTAMVGFSGLIPTIHAIKAGKKIALANKETLVVAGELIQKLAVENKVELIPVDSEHSAIFQCLAGEYMNPVEKIILTCSGGPFHAIDEHLISSITPEQALQHPSWAMGAKITIDSATFMNKGFEVIEAKWLFGLKPEQIEVLIHRQSVIHSMVEFQDGSIKALLGLPDMRLPIQYAFSFPERLSNGYPKMNFADFPSLTFEAPKPKIFRNLALAYEALRKGGNLACILNAANEIAVEAFLTKSISFPDIWKVNELMMERSTFIKQPTLDDYLDTNREVRAHSLELVNGIQHKH